jgi:hypothetical protein
MRDLLFLSDVCRALHVPPYRVDYLLRAGRVPDVPKFGGRRMFTWEDVERLRVALVERDARGRRARV